MLSDILGTVIGFVSVILLLSVVVTAAVQATQAVLRLRGRNLERGLTAIFQNVRGGDNRDAKDDASRLLNAQDSALLSKRKDPEGSISRLLGPPVSWLDSEQLDSSLNQCAADLKPGQKEEFIKLFKQLNIPLQKRFLRTIRLWTILWAFVVAIYFQVSAPALLNDLWTDKERRDLVTQTVPMILSETEASLNKIANYEDVSAEALEQLANKYPTISKTLEEVSSIGANKTALLNDLSNVLEGEANKQQIIIDYAELLEELYLEQLDSSLAMIRASQSQLSQFQIIPWSEGSAFFFDDCWPRLENWVGVLITVVLLSFGAPFWFGLLKNVLQLRDALKPIIQQQKPNNDAGNDDTVEPPSSASAGGNTDDKKTPDNNKKE